MARDKTTGRDFIFPSSSVVTEMYKESGSPYKKIEKAFMSPLVIYTWDPIVNALSATGGVVSKKDNYYRVDMKGLIGLIAAGKKWNEYGVDSDKRIYISTTDPNKSTSGNLFTGLLSYILNDSAVVDDATLPTITKQVRAYFGQEGYMESSSDDVFNNFMTMGYGAYPLLAGYESQLFSFMSEKPEFKDILQRKIKVLYPSPTVWSNHDVIAITDNGIKLINGLKDPEIQGIAWNTYGFRIGLIADGSKDGFTIPVDITNVIQMPKPYIINSLLTQ